MPIEAPDAGTLKEIRCKESQPVNEGDVLVAHAMTKQEPFLSENAGRSGGKRHC